MVAIRNAAVSERRDASAPCRRRPAEWRLPTTRDRLCRCAEWRSGGMTRGAATMAGSSTILPRELRFPNNQVMRSRMQVAHACDIITLTRTDYKIDSFEKV